MGRLTRDPELRYTQSQVPVCSFRVACDRDFPKAKASDEHDTDLYYTRTGLDYAQRETITFCFLAAQGGCELQLTSHAAGDLRVGNDKAFLIRVISQCLPYIGYPRRRKHKT